MSDYLKKEGKNYEILLLLFVNSLEEIKRVNTKKFKTLAFMFLEDKS